MKHLAKLVLVGTALGLSVGFGSAVMARAANDVTQVNIGRLQIAPEAERVDSFTVLTRPHSWTAVDADTVIVWATPFHAYLVELAFPSHDLRFTNAIGVTSTGSRVYAKFDAVQVHGLRYPIDSIYKLTREEARNWKRAS